MSVTLRQRKKNGKISLYLDYYNKGKRKFDYLGLYLTPEPCTKLERATNKQTLDLANKIRAKSLLEFENERFGFKTAERADSRFLLYFEMLTEKRQESKGNYGNWLSSLAYLKKWEYSDVSFSDIDNIWLEDLKHYFVHEAKTKQGRSLSQNTCVSYFNKVLATLKQAVKDGIIERNPAVNVTGIKEAESQREFLTLEELKRAVNAKCDVEIVKTAFLFSALTGLRYSDIEKMTWSEIQHSKDNGYYIRFRQKKTKGQETLPIPEDAIKLIGKRGEANDKVFQGLTYSEYNNAKIREWMIRAGVEKHITFHCARHTYATLQLTLGTDIYTVSKLLGHKNLKTTQVYAKIIDGKKKEAANRIKLDL
ncbi:site-specific recombinase XerD [Ancylomarina subtilis]|uniref:Site-specific recombinase XerD n=1 Tax=Ancylomarina subtilis TaxID=1639035 RepID=A0A4V2FSY3_9BACT|nr:site-specific integrase [Ancylomarina subtilis]RZT96015.1 site-specific recombinase XerD [Ancylomarina subtilis]